MEDSQGAYQTPTINIETLDGQKFSLTPETMRFFDQSMKLSFYETKVENKNIINIPITHEDFQTIILYAGDIELSTDEESLQSLFTLTNSAFKLKSLDLVNKFKKPLIKKIIKLKQEASDQAIHAVLEKNQDIIKLLIQSILITTIIDSKELPDKTAASFFMPPHRIKVDQIQELLKPLTAEEAFDNFYLLQKYETKTADLKKLQRPITKVTEIDGLRPELKKFIEANLITVAPATTKRPCCIIV